MKKVWFITGCSTGFGRELTKELLQNGYRVVVTARQTKDVQDLVADYPETAISVQLDVTVKEQIKNAVQVAMERFGQIDVLVNNAGIGYFGAIEESEEAEVRRMFEINVFGLAQMTQEVLPHMRAQRSGHILNIASIGGLRSFPGVGFYNATKYAVDGLSEALAKEVAPLGIKVTVIAPSGFRTDWAGRSAKNTEVKIEDYASTAWKNMGDIRGYSGNQPGDPVKAAKAMIQVVETAQPPMRLLLGAAALKGARLKLEELKMILIHGLRSVLALIFRRNNQISFIIIRSVFSRNTTHFLPDCDNRPGSDRIRFGIEGYGRFHLCQGIESHEGIASFEGVFDEGVHEQLSQLFALVGRLNIHSFNFAGGRIHFSESRAGNGIGAIIDQKRWPPGGLYIWRIIPNSLLKS